MAAKTAARRAKQRMVLILVLVGTMENLGVYEGVSETQVAGQE